jgi:hypothetical protein
MTARYADRDEVFEAGEAFYTPPGDVPVKNEPGTEIVVQPQRRAAHGQGGHDMRMPSKAVPRPAGSWSVLLDLVGVEANPDVDWLVA